jgi:hypothetical protein
MYLSHSIRVMFSIADALGEDDFESETEGDEEDSNIGNPIRTSLSITKVCLVFPYFRFFVDCVVSVSPLVREH